MFGLLASQCMIFPKHCVSDTTKVGVREELKEDGCVSVCIVAAGGEGWQRQGCL